MLNNTFPGVSVITNSEALILSSQHPMQTLASSVVGGGFQKTRTIINRHVDKNYDHPDPAADLHCFAQRQGLDTAVVGLITACYIHQARAITLREDQLIVTAIITAGVSNASSAGLSKPANRQPGTINMIILTNASLFPSAMVNAVMTCTEAKTHTLISRKLTVPGAGFMATGTSTDAVVIACTGRGVRLPYAGPATTIGWLMARAVRQGLTAALDASKSEKG